MTLYEIMDSTTIDCEIRVKVFSGDQCVFNQRWSKMTEVQRFLYREYEISYIYAQYGQESGYEPEMVFELTEEE